VRIRGEGYRQGGEEIGQVRDVFEDKTVIGGGSVGGLSSDWTVLARSQRLALEVSGFGIEAGEIWVVRESAGFEGG
jgi:hypothetical protein